MQPDHKKRLIRLLPIAMIVVAGVGAMWAFGDRLSFAALAEHHEALQAYREAHFWLAAGLFVLAYAAIVALSLPAATLATLVGGFLFGLFPGVVFNVIGAGLGATLIFLAVRMGFGEGLAAKIDQGEGPVRKLKQGIDENQWSVLFLMRLVPVVPFFVANVVPALLAVPLGRFMITTFLGILPGALVYTGLGAGLGEVIARGETPELGVIFTPPVLLPMLGLAALAALPLLFNLIRKERPA